MKQLQTLPVLPLRGLTAFPNMLIHFDVGRAMSIKAVEKAMKENKMVFLSTQEDLKIDAPKSKQLYKIGTIAKVKQIMKLPNKTVRVLVQGISRGEMVNVTNEKNVITAEIMEIDTIEADIDPVDKEALLRVVKQKFDEYLLATEKVSSDIIMSAITADNLGYLADHIAQHISIKYQDKQKVLEEIDELSRIKLIAEILTNEVEVLDVENTIQAKLKERIDKNQKEYYLREQMKVIREELGEEDIEQTTEKYRMKIFGLSASEEVCEKLNKEVDRLAKTPASSPEANVIRTYLDTCFDLPWNERTVDTLDLLFAEKILNNEHYGLLDVKERILEFLAVKQISPEIKGQILCLAGPPGVGKTSVASSLAHAMGRKFVRVSLGGVRDEADIRGHRKTYIGSMPGRIINAMINAKSSNPIILLDEVDKMSNDFRGDPASALLEVLDKEQNKAFRDHYLEIPFDLSDVLFITTANDVSSIPRPLLDRMELITLDTYTDEEKFHIAKNHLLIKQLRSYGLKKQNIGLSDDMLRFIIISYTRESGVRKLEQLLGKIARKIAKRMVTNDVKKVTVNMSNVESFLGPVKYKDTRPKQDEIGVVNGLAFTSVGGELLQTEVSILPGTGKTIITGNLGKVMEESTSLAISYVRSKAMELEIDSDFYKTKDIHIHFPEGAVPKDGPSAGVTITTALISALTNIPVKYDIAMTGEISLRGKVMPIGGLKEKTMAAYRNGIKTIIVPVDNKSDLEKIDKTVLENVEFVFAETIADVIDVALRYSDDKPQAKEFFEVFNKNSEKLTIKQ